MVDAIIFKMADDLGDDWWKEGNCGCLSCSKDNRRLEAFSYGLRYLMFLLL